MANSEVTFTGYYFLGCLFLRGPQNLEGNSKALSQQGILTSDYERKSFFNVDGQFAQQ